MRLEGLRLAPVTHDRRKSRLARGLRECGYCGRTMMGHRIRRLPNEVWRCNQTWACELVRWRLSEARAGRDPYDGDGRAFQARVVDMAATRGKRAALRALEGGRAA